MTADPKLTKKMIESAPPLRESDLYKSSAANYDTFEIFIESSKDEEPIEITIKIKENAIETVLGMCRIRIQDLQNMKVNNLLETEQADQDIWDIAWFDIEYKPKTKKQVANGIIETVIVEKNKVPLGQFKLQSQF